MSMVRKIVQGLTDQQLAEMWAEGEEWDRTGSLPDGTMRAVYRESIEPVVGSASATLWLDLLHHETWRETAVRRA